MILEHHSLRRTNELKWALHTNMYNNRNHSKILKNLFLKYPGHLMRFNLLVILSVITITFSQCALYDFAARDDDIIHMWVVF